MDAVTDVPQSRPWWQYVLGVLCIILVAAWMFNLVTSLDVEDSRSEFYVVGTEDSSYNLDLGIEIHSPTYDDGSGCLLEASAGLLEPEDVNATAWETGNLSCEVEVAVDTGDGFEPVTLDEFGYFQADQAVEAAAFRVCAFYNDGTTDDDCYIVLLDENVDRLSDIETVMDSTI